MNRSLFKNLQNARKTYKQTHSNISVKQPTLKCTSHLNKPKLPLFTANEYNFQPQNKVASFFNENGQIMKTPINLKNAQYLEKNGLHPIDWQKFGNRPTRPVIQTYEEHMLSYTMQEFISKRKQKKPLTVELLTAMYNNNTARKYVKELFQSKNKTEYSKIEMKQKIIEMGEQMKTGDEKNIYFKYPNGKHQYILKGLNHKNIYKVSNHLKQKHPIRKTEVVLTRIKMKKRMIAGHWDYVLFKHINDYPIIEYTLYYGKGERGRFQYTGRQIFY